MWARDILEEQSKSVLADTDEQSDFPKRKLERGISAWRVNSRDRRQMQPDLIE
jgi:hypothetical protein